MSVRIAIIGAGIMGADHARIFSERLPGTVLQIICDADRKRAQQLADALGAAHVLTEPEAAISRADVDAVVIASPDFTHAPLSLMCIKQGKPVLCEKPLSQSSRECLAVMKAEAETGRTFVQVGFMRRFDQSYVEMKGVLAQGKLGRPLMMHNFHRNVETPSVNFTGAMAITSSAPHEFDVARFVLNTEYKSITAFQPKRSDAVVAPVVMVLETIDDQLVTIEINNNAAYGYDVRGELVGEVGSIAMAVPAFSNIDMGLKRTSSYASDWRNRFAEAYWRQNREFLHFVRTGDFSAIASNSWDGYAAAVVGESGVQALKEGKKIAVKMIQKPTFYDRRREL